MKRTTEHFDSSYNEARSSKVKVVDEINSIDATNHNQVPSTDKPNSISKVYKGDNLIHERYYD